MALQVWLPLNGDLENRGLSNATITYCGAPEDNDGKIGKCRNFNNNYIIGDNGPLSTSTTNFSIAFWVKYDNLSNYHCMYSQRTATGEGITVWKHDDHIRFDDGTNMWESTYVLTANVWTHIVAIRTPSFKKIYINGELKDSTTTVGTLRNISTKFIIGKSSPNNDTTTPNANYLLGKLNDVRVYDHALSQREVKELSQALMLHYKLDINDIQSIENVNLVANGYGGTDNWAYKSSSYIMTDVPTDEPLITNSYGNSNYTLEYIPILQDHTYQASAWVKKTGSNYCYVAWIPYDIDYNQIWHYMTPLGFSGKRTTLSQDLKPGDTLVHLTSVSGWTNFGSVESLLAFFGYADSTGYVYPDYIYTRRCYSFDKTSVDTTNNTVSLTAAYSGETIKAGTAVCTSSYGATYYYSSSLSGSTTEWTKATANFTPKNVNYLKAARYLRFTCMSSNYNYNAGISLKDITYNNLKFYTYLQCDTSSYINSGVIPTTSTNFEMKYATNSLSVENVYFGCSTASGYVNGNNYSLDVLTSGSLLYTFRNQGYDSSNITTTANTPFIVKLQGDTFSINGNSMSANRHTSHPNLEIYLFARNVNGTVGNSNIKAAKLYYCKFWEGDTLIRDFVPCSYNGVYGLWDLCENKFYGNAGSGAFTVSEERPSPQNRIYDLSGYNRHAMLVSSNIEADTAVSRYDNCIKNLDSYPLKSVFDFPQSNGLTMACWIYLTTWGFQGSGLWSTSTSYTNDPSDYTATTCNHCDGKFYLRGTNGTTYNITCGTGVISLNTWNHVVLTHDGENIKVYVNGILKYTKECPTPLIGFKSLFLGYSNAGSASRQCKGKWSDFRMYATALSAENIADLYHTSAAVDNLGSFHTLQLEEQSENLFKIEELQKYARTGQSYILRWVDRNGEKAVGMGPIQFYENGSYKSILLDKFKENTQYKFDIWMDADDVVYNGNNVTGGLIVLYTDGTEAPYTSLTTVGNASSPMGFQHKVFYSDPTKTVKHLFTYYYIATNVYYRWDSVIMPVENTTDVKKTGISKTGQFREQTLISAEITKGDIFNANEFIEI